MEFVETITSIEYIVQIDILKCDKGYVIELEELCNNHCIYLLL